MNYYIPMEEGEHECLGQIWIPYFWPHFFLREVGTNHIKLLRPGSVKQANLSIRSGYESLYSGNPKTKAQVVFHKHIQYSIMEKKSKWDGGE